MHTLFDALHRDVGAITYQSWHTLRYSEIWYIIDAVEAADELDRQSLRNAVNECVKLMSLVSTSTHKLGPGSLKVPVSGGHPGTTLGLWCAS
ncbi:hypothetical protein F5B19DRAFT_449640 [Rostrohypoxylon terebratum]|nr:hypothetical protein F5B19DRAFT_449640 [Rostrohypoxylon terebratum]